MSMDRIFDHLPFFDGSGRRRFVAGGIILIGIVAQNSEMIANFLGEEKLQLTTIIGSPVIAGGAILLVYAIGSLAEMLGELSLVRAASAAYWSVNYPIRTIGWDAVPERNWIFAAIIFFVRVSIYLIVVFPMAIYAMVAGFFGRTRYSIDIKSSISDKAGEIFDAMPAKARDGLHEPVGNSTDFALKYVVDQLSSEQDRKWARRLLMRAKDVAATITALQVVVIYALISHTNFAFQAKEEQASQATSVPSTYETVRRSARSMERLEKGVVARYLKLSDLVAKVEAGEVIEKSDLAEFKRKLDFIEKHRRVELPLDEKPRARQPAESPKGTPGPTIRTERREINRVRQVGEIGHEIYAAMSFYSPTERKKEIKIHEEAADRIILNVVLIGSSFLFLLLYLGYFTVLRNAISSILEAIAQQRPNGVDPGTSTVPDSGTAG